MRLRSRPQKPFSIGRGQALGGFAPGDRRFRGVRANKKVVRARSKMLLSQPSATVGASMLLESACLTCRWCQAGSAVEDRTDFGGAGGCTRVRVRRTARARQGVPRRLPALPASRGLLERWMLFNSRCCFHSRGPWITREKKRASRKRPSRKKQV